jgi:hypothetical protein
MINVCQQMKKSTKIILLVCIIPVFYIKTTQSQTTNLVINEMVTANITGIHDEYDTDEQKNDLIEVEPFS